MKYVNWGFAILFLLACIGGIVEGANILHKSHKWGFLALAVCWALAGVIGIIRNVTFTMSGEDDAIFILADFSNAGAWTWVIDVLVVVGMVCFFISSPL
jgi:hypothetical protein